LKILFPDPGHVHHGKGNGGSRLIANQQIFWVGGQQPLSGPSFTATVTGDR
jgi:hypothetical protein